MNECSPLLGSRPLVGTTQGFSALPASVDSTGEPVRANSPPPSDSMSQSSRTEDVVASKGCCADLCNLIAKVIAAICDCLSGLPLIGSWFAQKPMLDAEVDTS